MQTKYTKRFKIEAVKKVLLRDSGKSISSVSRTLGIKISTLHGWIKSMDNKKLIEGEKTFPTSGENFEKSSYQLTVKEKFEILAETSNLTKEEISEYCRKKGLFPHHLEQWKSTFIESFDDKQIKSNSETKQLKNEIKTLSTELRRKEKALAEAAALLMLKKKANDLWGANEEL